MLAVGIDGHDVAHALPPGLQSRCADGRTLAPVPSVADHPYRQPGQHFRLQIVAAVVYHQHVRMSLEEAENNCPQGRSMIVNRNGHEHAGGHEAAPPVSGKRINVSHRMPR